MSIYPGQLHFGPSAPWFLLLSLPHGSPSFVSTVVIHTVHLAVGLFPFCSLPPLPHELQEIFWSIWNPFLEVRIMWQRHPVIGSVIRRLALPFIRVCGAYINVETKISLDLDLNAIKDPYCVRLQRTFLGLSQYQILLHMVIMAQRIHDNDIS